MALHKRFSSLSPKQKNEVFLNTVDLVMNTIGLPRGLRDSIRRAIGVDKLIDYRYIFDEMVKGQHCFVYDKMYFTLNVSDIKRRMEAVD